MSCGPGEIYFGNGDCNYPEVALKYALLAGTEPMPSTTVEPTTTEVIVTSTVVPTTTTTSTTTTTEPVTTSLCKLYKLLYNLYFKSVV
jgi:hypothetical protein